MRTLIVLLILLFGSDLARAQERVIVDIDYVQVAAGRSVIVGGPRGSGKSVAVEAGLARRYVRVADVYQRYLAAQPRPPPGGRPVRPVSASQAVSHA